MADDANIESEVTQAQGQFWIALQNKDREALEQRMADDFLSRSPGQPNQDRTTFINTLTGFPMQVRSIGSSNLEVHMFGIIAVVTGLQVAQLEFPDGQMKENKIAITNIFHQHEGRWLLKFSHAVSLD